MFLTALGAAAETARRAPALVTAAAWGLVFVGPLLTVWIEMDLTSNEPCDKFRQFIMPAFKFRGAIILIIFRFIRTLLRV